MATNGVAFAHGSATHPARVFRNMVSAMYGQPTISHANAVSPTTRGGAYGVAGGGDLAVTTTGGVGYSVAAGRVVAAGTFALAQGAYVGYNDAAVTGNHTRDATNPRINLLAWRVRDTDEDATTFEDDGIVLIEGTPAGSPVVPSLPSSLGTLAVLSEVLVPSSASGAALTYTERRQYATAIGGTMRVTSALRPTGAALWPGLHIYETDTGSRLWWDGAAWRYQWKDATPYTPTSPNLTIGNAVISADYSISDNMVTYAGVLTLGTTSSFPGGFLPELTLPVPADTTITHRIGDAFFVDGSVPKVYPAQLLIVGSGARIQFLNSAAAAAGNGTSGADPFVWAFNGNDQFVWSITYPAA